MPLTSSALGPLAGTAPTVRRIDDHLSISASLCLPDDIDALLNTTGQPIQTGDIPHCRVNVSSGAATATGRALSFLTECERLGMHVLVCGPDAQMVVDAYRHREIVR